MDAAPQVLDDVGRKALRKRRERKSAQLQAFDSAPAVKTAAAGSEQQTQPPAVATVDLISAASPLPPPAAAAPAFRLEARPRLRRSRSRPKPLKSPGCLPPFGSHLAVPLKTRRKC